MGTALQGHASTGPGRPLLYTILPQYIGDTGVFAHSGAIHITTNDRIIAIYRRRKSCFAAVANYQVCLKEGSGECMQTHSSPVVSGSSIFCVTVACMVLLLYM